MKQLIITLAAVLVTAAAWAQKAEIVQDWNGTDIGRNTNAYIGFYGHSRTNQQAVNAAASTNTAASVTVYTYTLTAPSPLTNIVLQTQVVTNLDLNGTTNIITYVTNVTVQAGAAPSLASTTTNTVSGAGATLANQLRAALVALGIVR